jgi:hypothetical protein
MAQAAAAAREQRAGQELRLLAALAALVYLIRFKLVLLSITVAGAEVLGEQRARRLVGQAALVVVALV